MRLFSRSAACRKYSKLPPLTARSDLWNHHFCKRAEVARVAKEVRLANCELLRDGAHLFRRRGEQPQIPCAAITLSMFHLLLQDLCQEIQFAVVEAQAQRLGHHRPKAFDIN